MSIAHGITINDLVSRVAVDLSDPEGRRWRGDQLVKFLNEGLRELAAEGAFRRTDLHVPTARTPYYPALAELRRVIRVEYDFRPLAPVTAERLTTQKGRNWRNRTGTPTHYLPDRGGVRLFPCPEQDGTPLLFATTGALTESQGSKIDGEDHFCALDAAVGVHFKPGDGSVSNAETAPFNLLVEYSFYPRPSSSADPIPTRYGDALVCYALFRAFQLSEVGEELGRAQGFEAQWLARKERLLTEAAPASQADLLVFADMEAG